jgi:hypothetical protein
MLKEVEKSKMLGDMKKDLYEEREKIKGSINKMDDLKEENEFEEIENGIIKKIKKID